MSDVTFVERLAALGAAVPEILLPGPGTDLAKWAVIACDQFTHDRAYWDRVRAEVALPEPGPSALNCIIPEAFLGDEDILERSDLIRQTMHSYLAEGLFVPHRGCVYVERDTPYCRGRRGLLLCLDLECYDWTPGSAPLIRPTEGTVPARFPPRMELRRGAALELPHILVLVDDEDDQLLPALGERAKAAAPLYDTPLMFDSGRVRGWLVDGEADECLVSGLEKLAAASTARYGSSFLFAVGDGNHSLAAAKGVWEEYKHAHGIGAAGTGNHPARYALVEIENLYDPAVHFEPIHRFVFGADEEEMAKLFSALPGFSTEKTGGRDRLLALLGENVPHTRFGLVSGASGGFMLAEAAHLPFALDNIQSLLDDFIRSKSACSLDYIHGEEAFFRLAAGTKGTGIALPPFKKQSLFRTIAERGILPRKSFSMGEACEKRFYLECRKLFG